MRSGFRKYDICLIIISLLFCSLANSAEIGIGLTYNQSGFTSNLANRTTLYFSGTGSYEIYDNATASLVYQGIAGKRFIVSGTQITIDGMGTYSGPLLIRSNSATIYVKVSTDNYSWKVYRGYLSVTISGGYFKIINKIDSEKYLYGVVPSEIGTNAPVEAAKAQAVCARTYTQSNIGSNARHGSEGFDICDLTHCQAYGGSSAERSVTNSAVDATSGIVLKYQGQSVRTMFYFSTCGGKTANCEDVWGMTVGYLKSINDRPATGGTDFCATASDYNWNYSVSATDLLTKLKADTDTAPSNQSATLLANGISVDTYDVSGRALDMRIKYSTGDKIVTGVNFRSAIGSTVFKSTLLTNITYNSGTSMYSFAGKGYGHGVGMCQDGAIEMATQGYKYDQILVHYFTGVVVSDTQGPVITHTAVSTAPASKPITVTATVTDANGVQSVTLYYRLGWSGTYSSTAMILSSSNTYSGTIPSAAVTLIGLQYYIRAIDIGSNITYSPSNYSTTPYSVTVYSETIVDTTPPTITHTTISVALSNTSIPVYAVVTDTSGVSAVTLYYRIVGSGTYLPQTMSGSGNNYSIQIPANAVTSVGVDYYIEARDGSPNNNIAYHGTGTSPHRITVYSNDTTPPVITHTPVTSATDGSPLSLSATVTDDISGVFTVTLYYRQRGASAYNQLTMTTGGTNLYTGEISATVVTSVGLEYYIEAKDRSSPNNNVSYNGSSSNPRLITVASDTIPPVVTHTAVTTAVENRALSISVMVTDNISGVASVIVYYRQTGDATYTQLTLVPGGNNIYSGEIPATAIKTAGLEYYIKATDKASTTNTSYWKTNTNPNKVTVTSSVSDTAINTSVFTPGLGDHKYSNAQIMFTIPLNTLPYPILKIFDLRGRLVRELSIDTHSSSFSISGNKGNAYWDGKTEAGEVVKSGIYLYQIEIGDEKYSGKLIVAR